MQTRLSAQPYFAAHCSRVVVSRVGFGDARTAAEIAQDFRKAVDAVVTLQREVTNAKLDAINAKDKGLSDYQPLEDAEKYAAQKMRSAFPVGGGLM